MIKMKTKNILVFFLALASVLLSLTAVNATEIVDVNSIRVNDVYSLDNQASVTAGEIIELQIYFNALQDATNVKIKAEIEGNKIDFESRSNLFTIEDGYSYKKTLTLKVPYELKDEISDDVELTIKIWNKDYETEETMTLRVQRPTYNIAVMSVSTNQIIEAGDTIPVDVVIKNIGYNNLDDLYVTLQIADLGVKRTTYFGDIVSLQCFDENGEACDEDDEDTSRGRFYLKIPYDAESGIYTLEVETKNSDIIAVKSKEIIIQNDFSEDNVIAIKNTKNVEIGQDAEYELLIVNPTNKLKIYKIISESSEQISTSTSQSVVAVPAGSSKAIRIIANANSEGIYDFNVNVFSKEQLVNTVTFSANVSGTSFTTPIVVLTIILSIVFLVLLIVLIVLLGKKPEKKDEEFGESYY
jgi:hypothetical protein